MQYLYFIFLGISPAVFWLWYFYRKDKWEPEPKKQIVKIFFLGVAVIVLAGALEVFFQTKVFQITHTDMTTSIWMNLTMCFVVIAPIEEFCKYSVVKVFIYPRKDFNEKLDGVIYMVAAAMGFAALENVMYILQIGFHHSATKTTYVGILRGVLATPAHAIFSGLLGVYLGKAKFAERYLYSVGYIVWGFIIAIFLHGLYDTLVFAGMDPNLQWGAVSLSWGVIPLLLISGFILMRKVKKLSDESPFRPKE